MAQTTTLGDSQWVGGRKPFQASYGKLMMWFFLISDAFTFSTLLVVYGVIRFASPVVWADPEKVFTHFPGLHELLHIDAPLAFVGLMTFILIASSVTMVLAVEAGHRGDRAKVELYMLWTILGGVAFVSCQGYEWYHFIVGTHGFYHEVYGDLNGALHLLDGSVATAMADGTIIIQNGVDAGKDLLTNPDLVTKLVPGGQISADLFVQGANTTINQYAQNPSFANLFFFITGFHGSHVASGVLLNYIVYKQVQNGVMEERGHYEMVEKVGLYWHFVDLVWVFVFTFFYLV
jgi:cytochrome c oxidase subunit 3